jgi:hypothetical protein
MVGKENWVEEEDHDDVAPMTFSWESGHHVGRERSDFERWGVAELVRRDSRIFCPVVATPFVQ